MSFSVPRMSAIPMRWSKELPLWTPHIFENYMNVGSAPSHHGYAPMELSKQGTEENDVTGDDSV
jgi:hypothetical protein